MSKKKMTGREVLEEALRGCCSTYCDQYPRYEGEIDLGDDYENYMNNLIKRSKNPFQRYFNTIGKRVAGIAAAILIVFSCSMTVSAVREPVVEFFTNIYEKFVEIFFEEDDIENAPNSIETVYTLDFVPEGYMFESCLINTHNTEFLWIDENHGRIVFSQYLLNSKTLVDYEDTEYAICKIGDYDVIYIIKYDYITYFWNNNEYAFSLTIPLNQEFDDIIACIESVKYFNH